MHDWSDEDCVKILRHLREAAAPETQLVIVDSVIAYACPEPMTQIPGAVGMPVPAPLLPNAGYARAIEYQTDMSVRNYCYFSSVQRRES